MFRPARRHLVLGGARSGKSRHAEQLLRRRSDVTYVACGPVPDGTDDEWTARVAAHRDRRPADWATLETSDLAPVLTSPGGPLLIDCLSTWLSTVMDECGVWTGGTAQDAALAHRVDGLVDTWHAAARPVVAVSNEVGGGVVPATASGRRYRDELGSLNARLAAASDRVWLVTAGIARRLR